MTNDDRQALYLARVAKHRIADPAEYAYRFRRGVTLQAGGFPWPCHVFKEANVTPIRRKCA